MGAFRIALWNASSSLYGSLKLCINAFALTKGL